MSQKLFKILLVSVLAIGLVILGVILVRAKNKKDAVQISTNIENPFGIDSEDTSLAGDNSNNPNNPSESDENQETAQPINLDFISNNEVGIFQKISEEPVAGATFVYVEREIIVPEEVSANLVETYDFTGYPNLKFGDDRKEVADLKTVLNRQEPTPSLVIDNAFDTTLKNAVIDFQTRSGLTPDGVAAGVTYKKLNDFQGIKPKVVKAPEKETIEFVRYVDRANGYIFDKTTKLKEPIVRVTSTSIPRVYEAYFDNTKNKVLMRYLKDNKVENIVGTIKKSTVPTEGRPNPGTLDATLLSNRISFVSVLPNSQKFFYLTDEGSGASGFSYDFKSGQAKKIWSSAFTGWLPDWPSEGSVSLTTRSSGRYPGHSYVLDVKNNSFKNIISNVNGLTTKISPDGKKILYSSYEGSALKTVLMDVGSGQASDFAPTTLPEKCVWTKDSKNIYCGGPSNIPLSVFPDDWYKGETLFRDSLWKIDVSTNTAKLILDSAKIPTQIDITIPMINDKENYFIFINKHDNNLYGIDLSKI